jgi:Flp pilus assembly protein TadD
MTVCANPASLSRGRSHCLALAAMLLACACSTAHKPRPAAATALEGGGFTITERVRVSAEVREQFERAVRLLREGRTDEGIALLVTVTAAAPDLTAAHLDLAMAYQRVGDLARAEASASEALRTSPEHVAALNELGVIQRKQGRFAEARQSYERALALQPSFQLARRNLAILCDVYLGDEGCALEQIELYARSAPSDTEAARWLAELRSRNQE